MYIMKNALKSISRSKARNILIGIIALIIAISACIALSIKEAAIKTKEDTLAGLEITGQISVDRSKLMSKSTSSSVSREEMASMFKNESSLTLDQLQVYAAAKSVKDFYYTITTSLDAGDGIEPIDSTGVSSSGTESNTGTSSGSGSKNQEPGMPGGGMEGGMGGGRMGVQGDFTVIGYSSDAAMKDFINSVCTITDGSVFEEGTAEKVCLISDELATYNSLSVGDTIMLVNPNNEEETIALTIKGIYNNSASTTTTSNNMRGFSTATDSANQIYMSYNALNSIVTQSKADAGTEDNSTTTTAITEQLTGTYVFASVDDYNNFETEARNLGLSDTYTISSTDLSSYEASLLPLENLGKMATYFLFVVFGIGTIILVVLNIFNIRERKYEIGVLTAIGMKKIKVASQFVCELFIITFAAIIIGSGIGAVTSVPVTDALLATQIESNTASAANMQQNFGRGSNAGTGGNLRESSGGEKMTNGTGSLNNAPGGFGGIFTTATNYVSEVSYSTNLTVILQLILVGILLTLISSLVSVLFIMRYEPLKILANRD